MDAPADARPATEPGWAAIAPLREPTFRTIWSASLLSNFGQLILGVGAAWEMTRLSSSADMVALVQAALMLPLMLVSVPAGAIADMFDRRKVAMSGLAFASLSAGVLTALSASGLTTPAVLLLFCVLIGGGVAVYSPAWQSSISEQVSAPRLPAAVALGGISYNLARSFGPAVGGVIVLAVGATGAFAVNAVGYLPLLAAFFFWNRRHTPSRLPPERFDRAILSGARYAMHSPTVRIVLARSFVYSAASAGPTALAPLVAKDLLGGNASIYGIILGATGVGAVGGALLSAKLREQMRAEQILRLCALVGGIAIVGVGLSRHLVLTALCSAIIGAVNITNVNTLNLAIQLAVPRWVMARSLSLFTSSIGAGVGIGAWAWGLVANGHGTAYALVGSGIALVVSIVVSFVLPVADPGGVAVETAEIGHDPQLALAITHRSGPIVIEVDYRVDPDQARAFYNVMLKVQRVRQRNGAFDWTIARDLEDPAVWTERCHFPTWGDYLRHRTRFTAADRDAFVDASRFDPAGGGRAVRRRLERPFGSVRWRSETPDPGTTIPAPPAPFVP